MTQKSGLVFTFHHKAANEFKCARTASSTNYKFKSYSTTIAISLNKKKNNNNYKVQEQLKRMKTNGAKEERRNRQIDHPIK